VFNDVVVMFRLEAAAACENMLRFWLGSPSWCCDSTHGPGT